MRHPNNKWKHNFRAADSKWEKELVDTVFKDEIKKELVVFHPDPVSYTVEHKYYPDFEITYSDGSKIYIEAKGRFMDSQEAAKYKWVRSCLKSNEELVFLFMKPDTPMPHVKKRKDGTKMSHGEWATKNNFRWFTQGNIKEIL